MLAFEVFLRCFWGMVLLVVVSGSLRGEFSHTSFIEINWFNFSVERNPPSTDDSNSTLTDLVEAELGPNKGVSVEFPSFVALKSTILQTRKQYSGCNCSRTCVTI